MRALQWIQRTAGAVVRFGEHRSGNVAMMWALMGTVLIALVGLSVDFTRAVSIRSQMQNAIDGAALVAARSIDMDDAAREQAARAFFDAEMGDLASDATFDLEQLDNGTQRVTARMPMPVTLARLISNEDWTLAVAAEAEQSGVDVEVAMILDTTGSMAGQRISDLRAAAADLVDIVIRDDQSDYYSKVALVPYSMAVNAGPYAQDVRGAVAPGRAITLAARVGTNVTVTAAGHGFTNGQRVYITGMTGITQLNNRAWAVSGVTAATFIIAGVNNSGGTAGGGGTAYCTDLGCEYHRFTNAQSYGGSPTAEHPSSTINIFRVSTCVTERTGAQRYTDAPPSSAPVGFNYPSSNNACPSGNVIVPLTSDAGMLTSRINALTASGSTGGHLGVAWGWYMLSPRFGYLWPSASRPAAYNAPHLMKIAVLMTDGEYNSSYCNGVISGVTSTSGSGSRSDQINCAAPNGHAFDQAQALCAEMKEEGVIVYTVGFEIVNDQRARDLVNNCATDDEHVYFADNGAELRAAFRQIALAITQLRITR